MFKSTSSLFFSRFSAVRGFATKTPVKPVKAAAKPKLAKPPKFMNGYALFFQENFSKLATPESKTVDTTRAVAKKWKETSKAEQEAYMEKAKVQNDTHGLTKAPKKKRATASSEEGATTGRRTKRVRDPTKAKREPTAYNLFVKEGFETLKAKNSDKKTLNLPVAMADISKLWAALSAEEKQAFAPKK